MEPNNVRFIQYLEQKKFDPNLTLEVNVVRESQNRLAYFLANDVAQRRVFGMARKIWRLDLSLGPVDERFQIIEKEDYPVQQAKEDDL